MLRSLILSREKGCLDVPNSLFRVVEQPLRSHETVVSVMRESLFRSFRMLLCDGYYIYMRVIYMFPRLCVSVLRISRVNIFYRQEAFRRSSVCVVRSRESGDGMISDAIGVNVC